MLIVTESKHTVFIQLWIFDKLYPRFAHFITCCDTQQVFSIKNQSLIFLKVFIQIKAHVGICGLNPTKTILFLYVLCVNIIFFLLLLYSYITQTFYSSPFTYWRKVSNMVHIYFDHFCINAVTTRERKSFFYGWHLKGLKTQSLVLYRT